MSERYPGGIISKTPVTPTGAYETSSASGVWTLDQQAYWAKLNNWPTAGNVQTVYFLGYYNRQNSTGLSVCPSSTGGVNVGFDDTILGYPAVLTLNKNAVAQTEYTLSYGSNTGGQTNGISTDSSNNIYFSGSFGSVYYGFIAKYNSSGTLQWQASNQSLPGFVYSNPVIDSSGNVFVTGGVYASDFSSISGSINKFNSSGTEQWSKKYTYSSGGGSNYFTNTGVALDSSGNVYAAGSGQGIFGYIVKFNTSGTVQWNKQFRTASTGGTTITEISIDSSGTIYYSGYSYPSSGIFYTIYGTWDSSGNTLTSNRLSTTYVGDARSCIDSSNNQYIFYYAGSSTRKTLYLVKINSSGAVSWSRTFSITSTTNGSGLLSSKISVDGTGSLYLSGTIYAGSSGYEVFYAKVPSDGTGTGTYTFGSATVVYAATSVSSSSESYTNTSVALTDNGAYSMSNNGYSLTSQTLTTNYPTTFTV